MLNLRTLQVSVAAAVGLFVLAGSTGSAEAGHDDLFSLVRQLQQARDDDDREDAAEVLGKLGDPRALPALQEAAVYDKEDDVRDEARKAIQRIGDRRGLARHHDADGRLGHLIDRLRFARDDDDREDAAEALGKLGDPRALPALREAAVYDKEDDVRDEARKAIRRIGDRPGYAAHHVAGDRVDRLIRQLRWGGDNDDRKDAAKELGRLGDPRALSSLEEAAVYDGDKGVRKEAGKAAREIHGRNRPAAPYCDLHGHELPCALCTNPAPDNYIDYGPVPNYDYDRTESYYSAGPAYPPYGYVPAPTYTPRVLVAPRVVIRRPFVIRPPVVVRRPVVTRRPALTFRWGHGHRSTVTRGHGVIRQPAVGRNRPGATRRHGVIRHPAIGRNRPGATRQSAVGRQRPGATRQPGVGRNRPGAGRSGGDSNTRSRSGSSRRRR